MGEYKIIREVGKGGMGCVYEAENSVGGKVALKMMNANIAANPDYRHMFNSEVSALKKMDHPSIVRIEGDPFPDSSGNLYLPMEYVEGETIAQIVQAKGPFSEREAISHFCNLLDAFTYIHSKASIHRDVKPSNIMIKPDDSICVIDFGIAKDSKTSTGHTIGRVVGTDGYMSPEQAHGLNIDHRTDIYSLGCLLHYMLTGTHAIARKTNDYETICAILENDFPLVSSCGIDISNKTQQAILMAVNKDMTKRFQTAEEFKLALTKTMYKISIGRSNADIVVGGDYVSSHHLDIIWEPLNDRLSRYRVTIVDHSTNGTGINGRKIRNDSYSFNVDNSIDTMLANTTILPTVMIAGLPDYTIDWHRVLKVLQSKVHSGGVEVITGGRGGGGDGFTKNDTLSGGFCVLCFFVPIVGWILGGVWGAEYPNKARKAKMWAWIGFGVSMASSSFFWLLLILPYL